MSNIKSRDKSKKRAAILRGAEDVFIAHGYEVASMDKVAEMAGVSKKTVYNHFGSKENLLIAIVDNQLSERVNLETISYDPKKSIEEQLRAFALSEIYLINSPRRLAISRFLTLTFLGDLKFQREIVAKYPPAYGMLVDWLQQAQNDGKLQSDNLIMSAIMFNSMVVGAITWPALFSDKLDEKKIQPLLDEIIKMFMARYCPLA